MEDIDTQKKERTQRRGKKFTKHKDTFEQFFVPESSKERAERKAMLVDNEDRTSFNIVTPSVKHFNK